MSLLNADYFNARNTLVLLAWASGLSLLLWGLLSLHGIFSRERADATGEIVSRHHTLEEYAYQSLKQSLQQKLALANVNLRHILRDPLIPDNDILYFEDSRQILPRPGIYKISEAQSNAAQSLYEHMMDIEPVDLVADGMTPWNERLNLLSNFKLAVESHDAAEIRWTFREISEQRRRAPLSGDLDIPYMLAVLDYLSTFASAEKTLVENIIRNGSIIELELGHYGLQRALLVQRELFTKHEFEFLRDKIAEFSRRFEIPYDDFLRLCDIENQTLNINGNVRKYTENVLAQRWYIEPRENNRLLGVAVELHSVITAVEQNMRAIGLLEDSDALLYDLPSVELLPLADLQLRVSTQNFNARLRAVENLYSIKTGLLFAVAALVVGIVVLLTMIQYRQQRYLAVKADFVSTVSHELKTPLAAVRLLSETLLRRLKGGELAGDYPERIIHTVDTMTLLVDNILSFNRLHKNAWRLKRSSVDVMEVIGELRGEFSSHSNLPLSVSYKNLDDVEINADLELVKILFRNLLSNACKYNERDNVNVVVEGQRNSGMSILFTDNGIGIDQAMWSAVFNEFSRMVNSKVKAISGTGLGLAICKKIMQLHKGSIAVVDSSPQGTTFKIQFPNIDDGI